MFIAVSWSRLPRSLDHPAAIDGDLRSVFLGDLQEVRELTATAAVLGNLSAVELEGEVVLEDVPDDRKLTVRYRYAIEAGQVYWIRMLGNLHPSTELIWSRILSTVRIDSPLG